MFDKIVFISDHAATIKLKDSQNITMNLMNLHIVFEDATKKILGEVNDVNGDTINASFLGEIVGNRFLGGTIRKPRLDAKIRVINDDEILLITGRNERGYMILGQTPFYEGVPVYLDVNSFFSSHFAIMGNSGSGKSCGISRLFQNMFSNPNLNPTNANIIMLDSSGEYYNAFSNLNTINPSYNYRFITTNEKDSSNDRLRIPIYLLNEADLALLLQATSHSQLPIIERMRKLALVFSQKDMDANNYKNYLIAKAIMTILYTNETAPNKRNEIFSVLASCSTPQFNLEAVVQGIGYTRKFRECFLIDNSGNFTESVLITEYVSSFIDEKFDSYEPHDGVFYTLDTLEKALNFTLISEGWLRNKNTYGDAVTIKVRLHSLIVSSNAKFFDVRDYMTVEQFLSSLTNVNSIKYQFVNINLDDVDDDFAKVITKIFSRLIFDYSKALTDRASTPYHIIVEEAHRYIQNDNDRFLIGYNIFERIAKEGRKYGVILGIITQRPVELSDTVISQCSNFLIFKMNHPVDVDYIRKMVPNISDEIVEKQKTLQAGTCLGFGSAFRIPMIVRMEMPNPAPWSGNCDVVSFWGGGSANVGMTSSHNMTPVNSVMPGGRLMSVHNMDTSISTGSGFDNVSSVGDSDNFSMQNSTSLMKMNIPEQNDMHSGEFGLVDSQSNNDVNNLMSFNSNSDVSTVRPIEEIAQNSNMSNSFMNFNSQESSSLTNGSFVPFSGSLSNAIHEDIISNKNFNGAITIPSVAEEPNIPSNNDSLSISSPNITPVTTNIIMTPPPTNNSNVTAAPDVNINMFNNTGDADDSDEDGGMVNFVNSEPSALSSLGGGNESLGETNFGKLSLDSEPNLNIPSNLSLGNDNGGMIDFGGDNENVMGNDFNPMNDINNINNKLMGQGNDGFAPPSNINFNNSDSQNGFDPKNSLVTFLGQ